MSDPDQQLPSKGNYLLNTDGSGTGPVTNPRPGAVGAVLRNPRGAIIGTVSKAIGPATNTEAEYTALIEGLRLASSKDVARIRVFVDSELIVDQLEGRAKVRAEHLDELHQEAARLLSGFPNYRLSWVPRQWNTEADALATAALVTDGIQISADTPVADDEVSEAQVIDPEGQAAWINERLDVPVEVILRVLDLEFEFMVGVGIVDDPSHEYLYYEPDELLGSDQIVDTARIALDAERILNVPAEIAAQIFDAEYQFMRMRGLAE